MARTAAAKAARAQRIPTRAEAMSSEAMMERAVESAIVRSVFGHSDIGRRSFMGMLGGGTVAAALASVFPIDKAKAAILDNLGTPEKTDLNIGFVPITCATPIIMAQPMGFYERYGLNAQVIKTAGWAVARDKSLSGEYDASHMLTPMPLAMTLGAGSVAEPYIMPAVENINGQAIVLSNEHLDKRDPTQWKGLTFGVPFEYSMHNFLLRYYVAEFGLDPDVDIQIRVVPPPEMVANLRAGNLDGYLSPDPFNQRAVWEGIGFIHMLTKEIWDGHPCCAFAAPLSFARANCPTPMARCSSRSSTPRNTPRTRRTGKRSRRPSRPPTTSTSRSTVIEQVLTGTYADGLGEVQNVPDRIDFDPFPWHSMGVWILTQMKRWGYIEGDIDYKAVAEQVYLAADAKKVMEDLGYEAPDVTYKSHMIMGKTFDPEQPEAYVDSFAIGRG